MSRSAAAVLLLAVVGPAAAQQPPPAVPGSGPAQPVPPGRVVPTVPAQPPLAVPAQPQNFVVPQGGLVIQGGSRGAGASAPKLVVARVNEGALVWSSTEVVPVNRQIDIPVNENGQQVIRKAMTTSMQQQTRENSIPLDGLKARDAAGKRIQPLALEIRLGKGAGVVLHTGPIADEIKAMFKSDAVFVEVPGGVGGFAQPAFAAPGGFVDGVTSEFARPAPVPGGAPPQPGLRVFPAPAAPTPAPPATRPAPPPPADLLPAPRP
ncbi:hypothetical protein J0H58_17140 [bacterium]|nr:hypothetical protein [bacterium]